MHQTLTPITHRVARWSDVEADSTHDAIAFRVAGREFARLSPHGDLLVPTTPALRDQLLTDGFADSVPRHSDRVRYRVRSPADVSGALRLLRVAYLHRAGPLGSDDPARHLHRLDASPELVALLVGTPSRAATLNA